MTSTGAAKTALVALNGGLPPHAEALDCEDLRGPRSLFGESAAMPRPIGRWALPVVPAFAKEYDSCCLLWEEADAVRLNAASRIAAVRDGLFRAGGDSRCRLDVPAPVFIVGSCTSSFSVAWKLCEDGLLPEWGSVLCSRQTEGRGQMRRHWHSPRGNLYVTFRLPDDALLKGDCASLLAGWLLVGAFRNLGFPLSLKWPNDLLLEERVKVGGVLLEERDGVLMAGLGVNLAEAPGTGMMREQDSLPAAVLLPHNSNTRTGILAPDCGCTDEHEEPLAPFSLWRLLVSEIILAYSCSVSGHGLAQLLHQVDNSLAWKGRNVVVRDGNAPMMQGCFMGLGPCGGMLLRPGPGESRELFSGSLFLR